MVHPRDLATKLSPVAKTSQLILVSSVLLDLFSTQLTSFCKPASSSVISTFFPLQNEPPAK